MKLTLTSIALFFIITACKNDQKIEKFQAEETIKIIPEVDAESPTAEVYLLTLQGVWKRTTYPYGTIEVKNKTIKFNTGEGAAEPAKFQNFSFSKTCPFDENSKDLQQNYIILEDKNLCNAFLIKADTLFIKYSKYQEGIPYLRMEK